MHGLEVELSAKEFTLLVKLASDPDRVFTREQLLRDVWGFRTYVPTRTLESHASRVRRKLAAAGLQGWMVEVWGVGYKLSHLRVVRAEHEATRASTSRELLGRRRQ